MIVNERDNREKQAWDIAEKMMVAARTAPKGKGVDIIECAVVDGDDKQQKLELSLDKIRKKFGFGAIKTAKMLNNDLVSKDLTSEDDLLPFKR